MPSPTKVFDYRLLRFTVGLIALLLAPLVVLLATTPLSSISASYYTEARDVFVGFLFVVGALMMAYEGHTSQESIASRAAAICAFCVALFPTKCADCIASVSSWTHNISAIALFLILSWFCLVAFQKRTRNQPGMKGRRSVIYALCGWTILGAMAAGLLTRLIAGADAVKAWHVTFWVEWVALWAFAFAWITAGKVLPFLTAPEEAVPLFNSSDPTSRPTESS